ncbi:vegetative incompatibility WD repeat [Brachionus plicatilis]|uniref:Vegetative incompatibility WD repeat n=1 Tax=Brachionus plicatilis TaxID=10195 RepID=A0A3M7R1I6_BRAPC|nr:vegetative incompatibility WD repeat [Brachionus plicatilis]
MKKNSRMNSSFILKKTLIGHTSYALSVAVLNNGILASGSSDKKIRIWSPYNGCEIMSLSGHSSGIVYLAALKNGDLASASADKTIKIWNTNNGSVKMTLNGHSSTVNTLVLLNNTFLASGSTDALIKIWNLDSGFEIMTLNGQSGIVWALVMLSNGDLASGFENGKIKIWNTNDGSIKMTLVGHSGGIRSLAVLNNGDLAIKTLKMLILQFINNINERTFVLWNRFKDVLKKKDPRVKEIELRRNIYLETRRVQDLKFFLTSDHNNVNGIKNSTRSQNFIIGVSTLKLVLQNALADSNFSALSLKMIIFEHEDLDLILKIALRSIHLVSLYGDLLTLFLLVYYINIFLYNNSVLSVAVDKCHWNLIFVYSLFLIVLRNN